MANTENIEAKLCAYVDGELDPAGRAEIEAHLETNPQHRQLMTQLMQQRDLLSGLPRERAPEDLFESMQNQLERSVLLDGDAAPGGAAGGSPHIAGQINRWPQRFAAAAVLLLAVGLAAVIYFVLPNQKPPDYARLPSASTGSSAPIARSAESPRRLDDLGAATSPTALARADADRRESKVGAMKAETTTPDRVAGGGPMTQPTAIAAGPTPSLPAAPPAAAPVDIFTKNAGNQSKSGDFAAASTMTNIFADAQINQTLKDAPGVPDNSMLVVVNAGNPSATNEQIRAYFDNNGIKWEPASEPMPEPLELRQSQTVMRSRLGNTQMKLKGGGNNDQMEGQGLGGFGGQRAPAAAAPPPPTTPPPPPAVDEQKNRDIAAAQEATSDRTLDAAAVGVDKNFNERSKSAEPSSPAPPTQEGAPSSGDAVALNAQKQMRAGSNVGGNASASTGAGAAAAAPQPNGQYAGKAARAGNAGAGSTGSPTATVGGKSDDSRENAATDDVQRQQQPRDEVAQAPSPSPSQPQAKSSESSVQSQSTATAPPRELEQQRQQGQQVQQQLAAQPSPQPSQAQQQQQAAQSPQVRQVFIARGVTKQQVVAMNNAIANGNRISNYNRAGATITPTTLPSLEADDDAAKLLLKEQSGIQDGYANKPAAAAAAPGGSVTGSIAGAGGAGGAAAPSTQPTSAPASPSGAFAEEMKKAPVATQTTMLADIAARRAATGPAAATHPATTETVAAAPTEERVDVVILVQPEGETALQQIEQPAPNAAAAPAPNAAATEPTSGPAPTTASPATTSAPATGR